MLEASRKRLLETLPSDAIVLDIGGWADPLERADWVIDLMPYETRGLYERRGWIEPRDRPPERFDASTWIQRDVCAREPYPFEDKSVDFVVCAQTLEDLRDPIGVCAEIKRVGKAGYVEVPSRLEEQSWGVEGPWVGWAHHRWLVDASGGGLEFTLKPHDIHSRRESHFPAGFWEELSEEERVMTLWWEDDFACSERVFTEEQASDRYLPELVERTLADRHFEAPGRSVRARLRSRVARALRT